YFQNGKPPASKANIHLDDIATKEQYRMALNNALNQARQVKDLAVNKQMEYAPYKEKDIRYDIEWHRKFTLAVSCLLLFGIGAPLGAIIRSEEHTSELQSRENLVCRLLLEKKKTH